MKYTVAIVGVGGIARLRSCSTGRGSAPVWRSLNAMAAGLDEAIRAAAD